MRPTDQLASQLFLSDLTGTKVYFEIQTELQAKYPSDADGEFQPAFWAELTATLRAVLLKAADMAQPANVS